MKKYLKTPEEVIKAFKDGKEVKNTLNWTYKFVDGFIVLFSSKEDNHWTINSSIGDTEKPYIEEAEPLKFEVGKFYKMRNGEKALLVFVGEKRNGYWYKFVNQKDGDSFWTNENGLNVSVEARPWSIIGEWEE